MINPAFRRLFKVAVPGWLSNPEGDGERVLYSLGKLCDAWAEKQLRGLEARFPGRASPSANALTAGDRRILRGRSESEADFAARLREWRNPRGHKVRGNAYEALLQIWHYWGGIYASTIDAHGLRHEIHEDDAPDVTTLADPVIYSPWIRTDIEDPPASSLFPPHTTWDDTNADTNWSRFWVVLQPQPPFVTGVDETPNYGDPELWGGGYGVPGYTLGQVGVTPEDVSAMRSLFQELKWGQGMPEWLVLVPFDGIPPDPEPEGTWKYWSKDSTGIRIASRESNFRYWSLAPEHNNTYSGSRAREWPAGASNVTVDAFYTGDRSNASAWGAITLPNGQSEYTGVRSFASNVLLVDDGSVPK